VALSLVQGYWSQEGVHELQARLMPRRLTDEQQGRVVAQLRSFAGQEYTGAIAAGIADGRILWESLYRTLTATGWKMVPPSSMGFGNPPAAVPISPGPGVVIFSSPSQAAVEAAAKALAAALMSEGIAAAAVVGDFGDVSKRQTMIAIVIGAKPDFP
jgi:hypothetical protein